MHNIVLSECAASEAAATPLENSSTAPAQSEGWNCCVPIRLMKKEAALFRYSLEFINFQHQLFEQHEVCKMNMHPNAGLNFLDYDLGVYDAEMMAAFHRALEKVKLVTVTHKRLRMDVFELAACLFALRHTATQIRHGHWRLRRTRASASLSRFQAKLERHRKQAKRAFIHLRGRESFRTSSRSWKRTLRWVSVHCLSCSCKRARVISVRPALLALLRERIDLWTEYCLERIARSGQEVPPKAELEILVRRALGAAKRRFGIRGGTRMDDIPIPIRAHMWRFVSRNLRKRGAAGSGAPDPMTTSTF